MIDRRTSLGVVVLAGLVSLSYWAGQSSDNSVEQPIEGLDTRLDYALEDFEVHFYDALGQPSARLRAPELANDAATGIGEISNPEFEIMHRGNLWHIVAESASVAADRESVMLRGNVNINRHVEPPVTIETSELALELTPRVASTERRVRILDGDDVLEALGFAIDMTANRYQLFDQVRGTYVANPQ